MLKWRKKRRMTWAMPKLTIFIFLVNVSTFFRFKHRGINLKFHCLCLITS